MAETSFNTNLPPFIVIDTGEMTGFALSSHSTVEKDITIPAGYEPIAAVYQRPTSSYPSQLVTCSLANYPTGYKIAIHNGSNDYMPASVKYAFKIFCQKIVK